VSGEPEGFRTGADIAREQGVPLAAAPAEAHLSEWRPPKEWSDGWRNLVLDLVDPDRKLTDIEVAYFFARANKLGLDPLARQIFPVKLQGRMEPFVGIHGIRMLAERTGQRAGEQVTNRSYESSKLISVEVTVYRQSGEDPAPKAYSFTARMDEFAAKEPPATDAGRHEAWLRSSWVTKPEVMLTKCAAANAYRMGFPEVLGGLYIPEEVE